VVPRLRWFPAIPVLLFFTVQTVQLRHYAFCDKKILDGLDGLDGKKQQHHPVFVQIDGIQRAAVGGGWVGESDTLPGGYSRG